MISEILLVFCLLVVFSKADEFTTVTSQENQVISYKDVKKLETPWTWSQPDTASAMFPEPQTLRPNFAADSYLPGLITENNGNRPGSTAQRAEYFPYSYEVGPTEERPHHVSQSQNTENALGSITKHFAIVSFIGLLLLFSIVQNSMSALRRKESLLTRRKRETIELHGFDPMTPEQESVLSEDTKVRCMQLTLCLENEMLRKNLGAVGKLLAKYLTRTVKNSVERSSGWDRLLEDAAEAGLRGEDCRILYRDCSPTEILGSKPNQLNL